MWQVIGHDWVLRIWERSIAQNHVVHAYLLTGPAHIGKTTLAKGFAQALNCTGADRPCGNCLSCRKISQGIHPDVQVLEGVNGSIKIAQIRQLQNDVSLSAHESPWKVAILRNMDQATPEAANCLLKTLEEPPRHVVLVLTATSTSTLLPTLVSRCQVLPLRPLSEDVTRQALSERWGADPEQARLLARVSGGRLGWAVAALNDEGLLSQRTAAIDALLRLTTAGRVERMRYGEKLSVQREAIQPTLEIWQTWWRDLLMIKMGLEDMIINLDRRRDLQAQAAVYERPQIEGFTASLNEAKRKLEQDVNARLALEALFLRMPSPLRPPEQSGGYELAPG